jgi:predicted N-acyltransferase
LPRIETDQGVVCVARGSEIDSYPAWERAFARQHKDRRYYRLIEQTLLQGFEHFYFVLQDQGGNVRAVQPFFLLDQDLLQGVGAFGQGVARQVRRVFPRCFKARTLMVGCMAGEGQLDDQADGDATWIARSLHAALRQYAKQAKVAMVVLKEFPGRYRLALATFSENGFTRVPSLPMVRLDIAGHDGFESYMTRVLSKATRKSLRRKFKVAAQAAPLEMSVVEDISPYIDEVYPLYLQVFERSTQHFEKLTVEFLRRLGRDMPDKARFFIWRQSGKAVAFSVCLVNGDAIYDEYLGLDYAVALDQHLYFSTLRDVLQWAMERGLHWYYSTSMGYDPKLHLRGELVPLDLYVAHTSPLLNFFLRHLLPWMEPTRSEKILREFPNYADLWGDSRAAAAR